MLKVIENNDNKIILSIKRRDFVIVTQMFALQHFWVYERHEPDRKWKPRRLYFKLLIFNFIPGKWTFYTLLVYRGLHKRR